MRVMIIGIDALEYELVKKWNLNNLMQEEYGKVTLPITKKDGYFYSEPATPIMWVSFITGKTPKEHGLMTLKKFRQPIQWFIEHIYSKIAIGSFHSPKEKLGGGGLRDKISGMLYKKGFARILRAEDIKSDTIFDSIGPSIHLHAPVIDEDAFPEYRGDEIKVISADEIQKMVHKDKCKREFYERKKEIFEWLPLRWKLFMQYFFCLDSIQHVFFNNMKVIAEFYLMFDELIKDIRKNIDDDTLLLVISDHGQKKGIHTKYAFYSVNKPLGLKNLKLTDFRWIIEDLLKGGK